MTDAATPAAEPENKTTELITAVPPEAKIPTDEDQETTEGGITPFEGDFMEVTVDVASHLDKYEKAMETILKFMIRRTYAGDWVSHDKEGTPNEDRVVNPTGAAAERIARDLGIQEKNRTQVKKTFYDQAKHPGHYFLECEGDFGFRGRSVHAIGRASTLNPFHLSKANGDPSKIREEYLLQECWRDCTKQGIKGLFGLRRIPMMKLADLGYDITKVRCVNFKTNEGSQAAKNPGATAQAQSAEATQVTIAVAKISGRTWNNKPIVDVIAEDGQKYSWWGKDLNDADVKKIASAAGSEQLVTLMVQDKGKYKDIVAFVGADSR